MNYTKIIRNNDDYFDDLEDTDQFLWAWEMLEVPDLQPTDDWRKDLRSFLSNRSPQTGAKLRPRGQDVTGMGFALTLPKCVCILELLEIDASIAGSVVRSVQACLKLIERLAAPLRHKPDGISAAKVVAYAALQRFTDGELPMPHRHAHVGVLSLAWNDKYDRVTSADLGLVAHSGDVIRTLFHHHLAWELRASGYRIRRVGDAFSIEDFPREIVDRFCAGPRLRRAGKSELRPDGVRDLMVEAWRDKLDPAELSLLERLGRRKPILGPLAPLSFHMNVAAQQSFQRDYFRTVNEVVTEGLRASYGSAEPETEALAGWLTGQSLEGAGGIIFDEAGRLCWGTKAGLAEEKVLLDQIRNLSLAPQAWLPRPRPNRWWERMLAADQHRVAVLRADLKDMEVADLEAALGPLTLLVTEVAKVPLRQNGKAYIRHLQMGGRILFVGGIKEAGRSFWLDRLPAATGIPVLWQDKAMSTAGTGFHGLNLTLQPRSAVEVFVDRYSHQRSAYLVATADDIPARTTEIRRKRQERLTSGENHRHVLVPTLDELQPGMIVQFERNTGGFKASEPMKIVSVGEEQMLVDRPGGIQAFVNYGLYLAYRVYHARTLPLRRGDRIRLTRNIGTDAIRQGLRKDRQFVVRSVAPDGTAYLSGSRVLTPEAGHWEYAYCLPLEGEPPKSGTIVCDAVDLPRLAQRGWLRRGIKIVACAADEKSGARILETVLASRNPGLLPFNWADIVDECSLSSFAVEPETFDRPASPDAQPAMQLPAGID